MEIRNHTLYDKDLLIRYNRHYLVDFLAKQMPVILLVSVGFSIYYFINQDWQYGLIFLAMGVLFFVFTLVMQKITAARQLKKSPLVAHPVPMDFTFLDDEFQVHGGKGQTVKYFDVQRLFLSRKENLLILMVGGKPQVVDLLKFENPGDWDQLKAMLVTKIKGRIR